VRIQFSGRNVRQRAFTAATEMLQEEGWEALSVRAIAKRARIGASSIYHHFPNKESLLLLIAVKGFKSLTSEIEDSGTPEGQLAPFASASRVFLNHVANEPALHDLMFNRHLLSCHEELRQAERDAFNAFSRKVEADPRFPSRQSTAIATTMWALGRGLAATALSSPERELPAELRLKIGEGLAYLIERHDS